MLLVRGIWPFFSGLEKTDVLGMRTFVQVPLEAGIWKYLYGLVRTGALGTWTPVQKLLVKDD